MKDIGKKFESHPQYPIPRLEAQTYSRVGKLDEKRRNLEQINQFLLWKLEDKLRRKMSKKFRSCRSESGKVFSITGWSCFRDRGLDLSKWEVEEG